MNNLERNCKIVSYILTFIVFDIIFVSIFDRSMDLAGISQYVPNFTLALFTSIVFFKSLEPYSLKQLKFLFYFMHSIGI